MEERKLLERSATALRAGDLAAAERLCRQVLDRTPQESEALNILGAVAFSRRDFAEAERLFALATRASPDNQAALFNLGKTLEVQRRFDAAADAYVKILATNPNHVETRVRLGIVRYQQDRLDESARMFEKVLRAEPRHAMAALSLGVTYGALGRFEDAVSILRALVDAEPELIEAYHALADALYELHRADEAAEVANAALARDQADVQALVLLGQAEAERGDFQKAERLFRSAAAFSPQRAEPHMNLGVLLQRLGRIDEALAEGAKALDLDPQNPLAHFNFGMGLLLSGEFKHGWVELEWRMHDARLRGQFPYRDVVPRWDGDAKVSTLLIAREQGIGDFILVSRFLERIRERVERVVVEAPPEIASLYRSFAGIDELVAGRVDQSRLATIEAHLPLCSVPFVLGIEEADVAPKIPYLAASPERVEYFQTRFERFASNLKVGVVWSGNPGHLLDRYRSCPISQFDALADLEGIAWISLQKGDARSDLEVAPAGLRLYDLSDELADFDDTAGALAALDLLVAVDTSVAHLAGALGKPVWLLNGFGSYWLWQLHRPDSPWYPTMRLFRQARPNDWDSLFREVRAALIALRETRA